MKKQILPILLVCSFVVPMCAMEERETIDKGLLGDYTYQWMAGEGNTSIVLGKGTLEHQQFEGNKSAIVCFTSTDLKKKHGTANYRVYVGSGIEEFDMKEQYCPIIKMHVKCPVGTAICTEAGTLKVTNIIHTVVPNCTSSKQNNRRQKLLENSYKDSLSIAKNNKIRRLAFQTIEGFNAYPQKEAARVALKTVLGFLKDNPGYFDEIRFVSLQEQLRLNNKDNYDIYGDLLGSISSQGPSTASTIDANKLYKLEPSKLEQIKKGWISPYKNEWILGTCFAAMVVYVGWSFWHKK